MINTTHLTLPLTFDESLSYYEQIRRLFAIINDMQKEIDKIPQRIKDEVSAQYEDLIDQKIIEYATTVNAELTAIRDLISTTDTELRRYIDQQITNVNQIINNNYTALSETINGLREWSSEELDSLSRAIEDNRGAIVVANNSISALQKTVSDNSIDIQTNRRDIDNNKEDIANLQSRVNDLTSGESTINTELETVKRDVAVNRTSITYLDNITAQHTTNIQHLQDDISGLTNRINTNSSNIDILQNNLSNLNTTVTNLNAKYDTLDQSVTNVNNRMALIERDVASASDLASENHRQIITLQNDITTLRNNLNTLTTVTTYFYRDGLNLQPATLDINYEMSLLHPIVIGKPYILTLMLSNDDIQLDMRSTIYLTHSWSYDIGFNMCVAHGVDGGVRPISMIGGSLHHNNDTNFTLTLWLSDFAINIHHIALYGNQLPD